MARINSKMLCTAYALKESADLAWTARASDDAEYWQQVTVEKLTAMAEAFGFRLVAVDPFLTATADCGMMKNGAYLDHITRVSEDDRNPYGQVLR